MVLDDKIWKERENIRVRMKERMTMRKTRKGRKKRRLNMN